MRADRLVSLVLLLRQRGRLTAAAIANELEVSPRTVLRDIEALSASGVPVYAERGRHGGFALLPGFRTELTGLTESEALAVVTLGMTRDRQHLGLRADLAAALRKVVDALPQTHRRAVTDLAQRFLVEPEHDLLARRESGDEVDAEVLRMVRRGVVEGRRLRLQYSAAGSAPDDAPGSPSSWRDVDPLGLVSVRGVAYLLATRDGVDRTYRVGRISAAQVLDERADRPESIDLAALWQRRSATFRAGPDALVAVVRLDSAQREHLLDTAVAVLHEQVDGEQVTLEMVFQDLRHAVWAVWQLGDGGEALSPATLRTAVAERAMRVAQRHGDLTTGYETAGK